MKKLIIPIIFIILCFSQCQNVTENTLIASPETADTTKFPFKRIFLYQNLFDE